MCVFFFKQKTAYEMRISDWSSDVCSSDLIGHFAAIGPTLFSANLDPDLGSSRSAQGGRTRQHTWSPATMARPAAEVCSLRRVASPDMRMGRRAPSVCPVSYIARPLRQIRMEAFPVYTGAVLLGATGDRQEGSAWRKGWYRMGEDRGGA